VEAMQLLLCCGSCDVDDVILNLLGALLLYGLCMLPPVRRALERTGLFLPLPKKAEETPPPPAAPTIG